MALALGATACTSEPAPDLTPAEAADQIVKLMQLTPETGTCLTKAFEAKPEVVSAMNAEEDKQASDARVNEFLTSVRPCLTAQVLADAYPKIVEAGFTVTDPQKACIRQAVLGFDESTRDLLIKLGAGIPTSDPMTLSKPASELAATCRLDPVTAPGTDGTVGPGAGATSIVR